MNKEVLKLRFIEDCKKLGIDPFDFDNQEGRWRDLYILHASRAKPGRTNSRERTSRVGVRILSRIEQGERQKNIYNALRAEVKAMKESAEGIEQTCRFLVV